MNVVLVHAGRRYDIDVRCDRPTATVGDLLAQLEARVGAGTGAGGVFVDGLFRPSDTPLEESGLHEAALVSTAPGPAAFGFLGDAGVLPEDGALAVLVLSGARAGAVVPLPVDGEYTVGSDPGCHVRIDDPTLAGVHFSLRIRTVGTVTVANRAGATRMAGRPVAEPEDVPLGTPILAGSVTVVVDRLDLSDRMALVGSGRWADGPAGTVSLNRPPRTVAERPEPVLDPPTEPADAGRPPFNVVSVIAPALFGLVMVLALRNVLWALFALLSPVMAVGNWWENRHRSVRALRASTRSYARNLEAFEAAVVAAGEGETAWRRAAVPNLADATMRAGLPRVTLWEVRSGSPDFLRLSLGWGDSEWRAQVASERVRPLGAEAAEILARHRVLYDVPVTADLGGGGVVGVVGDRPAALALARALVAEAAVMHGPADLRMVFLVPPDARAEWEWAKWLPHTRDQRGGREGRLVAADPADVAELIPTLAAGPAGGADGPATLFLVDGPEFLSGRASPARRLLSGQHGRAAGIVIVPGHDALPAACTDVVELDGAGSATVTRPRRGRGSEAVRPAGLAVADAEVLSLRLARFDDPELHVPGSALPPVVALAAVLEVDGWDPGTVARRWAGHDAFASLRAVIGAEEGGPFLLDLDRHGPHGLIGGTTGSGKSELLKTIVASLAATYPPDQLTFGLFDFKGGSTFSDLGSLPHTVGMASDLDVSGARRSLRCLRAELLRRERIFDEAGAADLFDLHERRRRGDPAALAVEAVPRLVVLIDEFAAMAKELADDIGAIVDLTARGRSLGVHLLLATQRPSGAVNAEIRTNTRLRICLKVEDPQDSVDVVGIPDAATVDHKGRGYFRVGQGEVLPIQTALSSGPAGPGAPAVSIAPFLFDPRPPPEVLPPPGTARELDELVAAVSAAFDARDVPPPRHPWPDPLPSSLDLASLDLDRLEGAACPFPADVVFALADDPDAQTCYPVGWSFGEGNLLLYGVAGSGTTAALGTVALQFGRGGPPEARHIYVISGSGELAPLAGLPHCAGVVRGGDRDRQIRLLRRLTDEMAARRREGGPPPGELPAILVVADNLESLRTLFEDSHDSAFWDQFVRIYADGPPVGIHVAAAATRIGGVPAALSTATPTKLVFRLADTGDFGAVGLDRRSLPSFVPGRAVLAATGLAVQVAAPLPSLASAVERTARVWAGRRGPEPLQTLAGDIGTGSLSGLSVQGTERWDLAVGVRDRDLRPALLSLYEGEHALVAGRARSGRSTALLTLAAALHDAAPEATVMAIASRRSPLTASKLVSRTAAGPEEVAAACNEALMAPGPLLLLIDDAETVEDPEGRLAALVASPPPQVHLAAAVNADALRGMFGHWVSGLRRHRAGLLLQPSLERDGDLLGTSLPYRVQVPMTPGRGFLVCGGSAELVQVARENGAV